jgi:hypothetical protein
MARHAGRDDSSGQAFGPGGRHPAPPRPQRGPAGSVPASRSPRGLHDRAGSLGDRAGGPMQSIPTCQVGRARAAIRSAPHPVRRGSGPGNPLDRPLGGRFWVPQSRAQRMCGRFFSSDSRPQQLRRRLQNPQSTFEQMRGRFFSPHSVAFLMVCRLGASNPKITTVLVELGRFGRIAARSGDRARSPCGAGPCATAVRAATPGGALRRTAWRPDGVAACCDLSSLIP